MNRISLLSFINLSILTATTINIPADYSSIQAGIDASIEGDTVLVSQGTYIENLILEKEIVLASHAIYDDLDDWMSNENIMNTTIVGSEPSNPKKGSCLQVSYGSIEPTILGFTFKDGLGTSLSVDDCGIYRKEVSGGAILAFKAYPVIMYNRFKNNGTSQIGGGNAAEAQIQNGGAIGVYDDDDVEFDEDRENYGNVDFSDMDKVDAYVLERGLRTNDSNSNRDRPSTMVVQNNYFENNSSGNGENIYSHGYDGEINVSGSVFENIDCENNTVNEFVLQSIEDEATFVQDNIYGACIEENSFYVSSSDGDDNNSGTETEPLKTIRHALTLVKSNSDQVTTIFLSAGIYSKEENGEAFPIVVPDNVHIIGDEALNTILFADANAENEAATMIIKEVEDVRVANITISGGYSEGHGCTGGGGLLLTADDMFNLDSENGTNIALTYPIIEDVIIENNHSHNGGGMAFFRVNGPVLNNVTIRDNTSTAFGGGVFSYVSTMTMTGVTITGNQNQGEGQGGGIMLAASDGVFDDMTITNNTAVGSHGGAIWTNDSGGEGSYNDGWTMTNSVISGNTSEQFGGGIMCAWSYPTIINCTIDGNTGYWGGGGIFGLDGGFILKESVVSNNFSFGSGGGINAWGPFPDGYGVIIEDCLVYGNETDSNGGGMQLDDDVEALIIRTAVFDNSASENIGGIDVMNTSATMTNVTISGNTSSMHGGVGIANADVDITNSIVWNNTGDEVWISPQEGGSATVSYSDIESGYDGQGNIDADPLFTDAGIGDYTLSSDSPCIDAGIADMDGDGEDDINEYNGIAPDMGAFEMTMAAPGGFSLYASSDYVILTWSPVDQEVLYYLLERSTDENFSEGNVVSSYLNDVYYEDDGLEFNTEYFYRVSYYADGWSEFSEVLSVVLEQMDVVDGFQLPRNYALHQNYPNPFNPVTNLSYDLPEDALVNITIYDMMGKVVSTLVNGQQSAGFKTLQWNATNNSGMPISAGLYIYTIQAGEFNQTRKMILLK